MMAAVSWPVALAAAGLAMLSSGPAAAQPVGTVPAAPINLDRPYSKGTPAEIPIRLKTISPGFHMLTGRGGNALAVVTPAGLVLVDSKLMYPAAYAEMKLALRRVGAPDTPILAYVTHHHADHSGGNGFVLADGARLIGQQQMPPLLGSYTSRIAPINPSPPNVIFDRLHVETPGGMRIEAHHWGPGHTAADTVVFFPARRIVAAGGLVYGNGEIAVDIVEGRGSLFGMLARVDDLLRLEFDIAVPGTGDNVLTRAEVILYRARLAELIRRLQAAVRAGADAPGLLRAVKTDDLGFRLVGHFWTEPRFMDPIYRELVQSTATKP